MRVLIILFVCHVIVMLVHTGGLAVAGRIAGASISEIAIFTGPALLKMKIRGVAFALNLLPIGSYVQYEDRESGSRQATQGKLLSDLHPLIRTLIGSAGIVALLALAAICLRPLSSTRSTDFHRSSRAL